MTWPQKHAIIKQMSDINTQTRWKILKFEQLNEPSNRLILKRNGCWFLWISKSCENNRFMNNYQNKNRICSRDETGLWADSGWFVLLCEAPILMNHFCGGSFYNITIVECTLIHLESLHWLLKCVKIVSRCFGMRQVGGILRKESGSRRCRRLTLTNRQSKTLRAVIKSLSSCFFYFKLLFICLGCN